MFSVLQSIQIASALKKSLSWSIKKCPNLGSCIKVTISIKISVDNHYTFFIIAPYQTKSSKKRSY